MVPLNTKKMNNASYMRVGTRFTEYPALSKKALDEGFYLNGLRYWYSMYEMAENHPGHEYEMPIVIHYLQDTFGITRRHAYKILQRNDGLFWQVTHSLVRNESGSVRIFTLGAVLSIVGLPAYTEGWKSHVNCLRGGTCRQWSWQTMRRFYTYKAGTPISRTTLEKLTGIPRRSQQLYDRRLKERRATHIEVLELHDSVESARKAYEEGVDTGNYKPYAVFVGAVNVSASAHNDEPDESARLIGVFRKMGNAYLDDKRKLTSGKNYERVAYYKGAGVYLRGVCPELHTSISIINRDFVEESNPTKRTNYSMSKKLQYLLPWLMRSQSDSVRGVEKLSGFSPQSTTTKGVVPLWQSSYSLSKPDPWVSL
jgi:hypothetical protein